MSLEERLARLEIANSRLRAWTAATTVLLAIAAIGQGCATSEHVARGGQPLSGAPSNRRTLEAEEIRLVDSAGRVRVLITTTPDEVAGIQLFDTNGNRRASLADTKLGTALVLEAADHRKSASIGVFGDNPGMFAHADGKARLFVGVNEHSASLVELRDPIGKRRVTVAAPGEGGYCFSLLDGGEQARFSIASLTEDAASMVFFLPGVVPYIALGASATPGTAAFRLGRPDTPGIMMLSGDSAAIGINDAKGDLSWRAP